MGVFLLNYPHLFFVKEVYSKVNCVDCPKWLSLFDLKLLWIGGLYPWSLKKKMTKAYKKERDEINFAFGS